MELTNIPGTNIPDSPGNPSAFSLISPLVTAAGGLSLSQIKVITGLEGSTIQNWVKRGWVSKPQNKKYDELQLARILLISALRDAIRIDQIVQLIEHACLPPVPGGPPACTEATLFDCLCRVIRPLNMESGVSFEQIRRHVSQISREIGDRADVQEQLSTVLEIMVAAHLSSRLQRYADDLTARILSFD